MRDRSGVFASAPDERSNWLRERGLSRGLHLVKDWIPGVAYARLMGIDKRQATLCRASRHSTMSRKRACSSAVEHGAHNPLVAGSIPAGPTDRVARSGVPLMRGNGPAGDGSINGERLWTFFPLGA